MGFIRTMGRRSRVCTVFAGAILAILMWNRPLRAQEITVVETQQQANERIKALSQEAKSVPHDYVIGNGDLLGISVFDVPELSRDVRVSQSGQISLPLVPVRLQMSGLTESQAEQKIAEVLEADGLVSHPEVGVMVREHKSKPITIVGAVAHPMVYEADRTVTLLEALAEAGGVSSDAGDTVIVTRAHAAVFVAVTDVEPIKEQPAAPGAGEPPPLDPMPPTPPSSTPASSDKGVTSAPVFPSAKPAAATETAPAAVPGAAAQAATNEGSSVSGNTITINLNELLEKGDTQNNITLQAGDVVTVPHAGIVYVLGAVNHPGGFVVSNDRTQLTALKILALAGGTTNIAKTRNAVIIRKDGQGKETQQEVDLKAILNRQNEDMTLRASDILYVPDDVKKQVLIRTLELAIALGSAVAIFRLAYH
jgi:protein involved in polysaccharide export with SLBB domain